MLIEICKKSAIARPIDRTAVGCTSGRLTSLMTWLAGLSKQCGNCGQEDAAKEPAEKRHGDDGLSDWLRTQLFRQDVVLANGLNGSIVRKDDIGNRGDEPREAAGPSLAGLGFAKT